MANERPYIYWKEDPNLNLVKISEETKNPQYDEQTNARIKEVTANAVETIKAFMNNLKSKDLVTESSVKKANMTGDLAHDKYPDRAVITVKVATDNKTKNPCLYLEGPLQGQPILSVKADIGHGTSHVVLTYDTKGKNLKRIDGREVMGRGEGVKWYEQSEIPKSLLDDGIKAIAAVAETYIVNSKELSDKINKSEKVNLPALIEDAGFTLESIGSNRFNIQEDRNIVVYQDKNHNWKTFNFAESKVGDAISFMQEFANMDYKNAITYIADFVSKFEDKNLSIERV